MSIWEYVKGTANHTDLERDVWIFHMTDKGIGVAIWWRQQRQTCRHKWRAVAEWTYNGPSNQPARPPVPPEMQAEVVQAFCALVQFAPGER